MAIIKISETKYHRITPQADIVEEIDVEAAVLEIQNLLDEKSRRNAERQSQLDGINATYDQIIADIDARITAKKNQLQTESAEVAIPVVIPG